LAPIRSFHNLYIKVLSDGKIRQPKATTPPGCSGLENIPPGSYRQNPLPGYIRFLAAWTENHPESMQRLFMTLRILYAAGRIFLSEIQTHMCVLQNLVSIEPADAECRQPVILSSDIPSGR